MKPLGQIALLSLELACGSCRREMLDQPRHKPFAASDFFADGAASRPLPAHTIARGHLREEEGFFSGKKDGVYLSELPTRLSPELLARGQERYSIYCSVCHGGLGDGRGMIVQRGFPAPPSFHSSRLREAPIGHYFEVITRGYGLMFPYASRIEPSDRWAIAAYIRALQLSQNATLADVEPAQRAKLEASSR